LAQSKASKQDTGVARPQRPNLRDAQKAYTRARILETARNLFYEVGYYNTTVDQIVSAVGASRPTFYLHFADKEAILTSLVEEYRTRAVAQMERLKGPHPSLAEIRAWMDELVVFYEQERIPVTIFSHISTSQPKIPSFMTTTLDAVTGALGRNLAAFSAGGRAPEIEIERRVAADLLVVEITWAGFSARARDEAAYGEAALEIVSNKLHAFVQNPRFARPGE
jgi:AcrR family transcriptional regulator